MSDNGEMFVPPQVQALGLRKEMETEEAMLDFIKKAADHRMTTSSDEGGRNRKIYQAGKSPNLRHIFGGPELPASRFKEVVGGFLWAHHHYMLGMLEDRRGTCCCSCLMKGFKFLQMCAGCFNIMNLININNYNN